jgi:hypothetical protein
VIRFQDFFSSKEGPYPLQLYWRIIYSIRTIKKHGKVEASIR